VWFVLLACLPPESEPPAPALGVDSEAAVQDTGDTGLGVASFTRVRDEVFDDKCVGCHFQGGASRYGDLALDGARLHERLLEDTSTWDTHYIVPFAPGESLVYLKMTEAQGAQGGQMPPYDSPTPFQVRLLDAWILAGAPDD